MDVVKVKRTYGKHKTATTAVLLPRKSLNNDTLEDSYWKDDDPFEKLLDDHKKKSQLKPQSKQKFRASFDRESLDESKIQQQKKNPKKREKLKQMKVESESSYDELYELYLHNKKQKVQLKRKQAALTKNVKVSTPVQSKLSKSKKKKTDLQFEVSPIKFDDSVENIECIDTKALLDSVRRQRLREIAESEKQLDLSVIREAEALLAKYKKPLKSSENLPVKLNTEVSLKVPSASPEKFLIMHTRKTKKSHGFKPVSQDDGACKKSSIPVYPKSTKNKSMVPSPDKSLIVFKRRSTRSHGRKSNLTQAFKVKDNSEHSMKSPTASEFSIPDIQLTSPEKLVEHNTDVQCDLPEDVNKSNVLEETRDEPVKHRRTSRKRKTNNTSVAVIPKRKTKVEFNESQNTSDCDKQNLPSVGKNQATMAKKSIAFDLVPLVRNISIRDSKRSKVTVRNKSKKSVVFSLPAASDSSIIERLSLKPGKWRRSLIAWRSSNSTNNTTQKGSSHRSIIDKSSAVTSTVTRQTSITSSHSVLLEQSDEGNLHAALSIIDASIKCATFHDLRKTSQRKTSVFERSSIFYGLQEPLIDVPVLSARQIALRRCGQQEPLSFDEVYSESQLPNCCKIGEGVYGEVFMYKCPTTHQPIVLKIIPIEGDQLVNGEPQKQFDEILQEIVISMELSGLRNCKDYSTDGFVNVKRVTCVQGVYPEHLIDEWELYRDNRAEGSDNDHPEIFNYDQLFVVFELCNGGKDLEAFVFNNAAEAQSVFLQTALILSVAERKFDFEHRDLHWGNILIAPTTEKYVEYRLDGKIVKLLTHGVKVTIIDYSLSRMVYDGAVLYDNLARDEELFQSTGDYQFDIYRLMRERVENNFERFEPYTNLLWLHYIVDKLINGARYRYSKTKKHRAAINEMMQERDELLNFTSASDYVSSLEF